MVSASRKRARPLSRSTSTSSASAQSREGPPSALTKHWPASPEALGDARAFLIECVHARLPTLLVPDKDADGLCGGMIVYRTLIQMGLPPSLISVHFVRKGSNVHETEEGKAMQEYGAKYAVVIDQGSRGGPRLIGNDTKTLVVDHHWSEEFPEGAVVLSAAQFPPVATSATLAYTLCLPLLGTRAPSASDASVPVHEARDQLEYLCAMGTMGDLGTTFRWEPPFPDMQACLKRYTKKALGDAVSLINAPRRTARFDVDSAWGALLGISSPKDLTAITKAAPPLSETSLQHVKRLHEARADMRVEAQRCSHSAPAFSGDGKVALIRISSQAQVHPLIATKWAGTLKSSRLQVVMCANSGYLEGQNMTNFSCRIARCSLSRNHDSGEDAKGGEVDIIALLKHYAAQVPGLRESMGENFARGHKEASGGIVRTEDFEGLWEVMLNSESQDAEGSHKRRKVDYSSKNSSKQSNTLEGWVKRG
ncbi:hypothetical protein CERSUDRAFT_97244 [Gelatoporia subvermispora B]|uniref:Uncharacterized protein n=1 Tax=Ceriporiopsis subvermispora (strain B) TaxID=914234 RepID=M2R887_CERS8|nr:hypothetical protein CERSUDRAFT_97244 [Gelatoporia subvermispora B]